MSVISLDPPIVGGKQKPPAVAGVGDENLEPKHKQMVRKLVNEAKDEQRPYLEVERSLQVKKDGKYHMNSFVSLHTFGLLLNPPKMPRPFSVQQKGPEWRAVEYWSGSNHACFQCTDLSKVELTLTLPIMDILCMPGLEVRIHYAFLLMNVRGGRGYVTSPNSVYLGGFHWHGAVRVKQDV